MQKHYDYIIAGGGCAGLSLAYQLQLAGLHDKSILIIDREEKRANDRTWCFWSQDDGPYPELVYKEWPALSFADRRGVIRENLAPWRYQLIRGIDFYRHLHTRLDANPNVHRQTGFIESYGEDERSPFIQVAGNTIRAGEFLFNSCLPDRGATVSPNRHHHLLQHFKGWIIETAGSPFDTETAMLMDFRTPQQGEARFFYVLPFSPRRALVEYTIFSDNLLGGSTYEAALRDYIGRHFPGEYSILEEENGVIPMTDRSFRQCGGRRILNIGTVGGAVKPTTGYAFLRIQSQVRQIADKLRRGRHPSYEIDPPARFKFYDRLLLNILQKEGQAAASIFSGLFRRNPMTNILTFLSEASNGWQETKIFSSLPTWPFLKALARVHRPRFPAIPGRKTEVRTLK